MASNVLEPASQPSLSSNPIQCTVYPCNAMQCNTSQPSLSSNPVQPNPCNAIQFNADCIHAMHTSQPNAIQCIASQCNTPYFNSYHLIIQPTIQCIPRIHVSQCIPNAAQAPNVQCYCNDSSEVQKISPNWLQLVQSEEWTKVVKLIPT